MGADGRAYDEVYYLGVIDILMTYTTKKVLETAWYNAVKGRDCNCSSQPPEHYAQRFFEFVQGRIVTPEGPLEHVRSKYAIAPLLQCIIVTLCQVLEAYGRGVRAGHGAARPWRGTQRQLVLAAACSAGSQRGARVERGGG